MEANLLSLEDVRMLLRGLDCLTERIRGSKEAEAEKAKAAGRIATLKARLEEGELCEAGSEEICASTRLGTFW